MKVHVNGQRKWPVPVHTWALVYSMQRWARFFKKGVDWSDIDAILPGKSICKAIVLLQIPEVLNDKAIQVLLCKKLQSAKRLYCFKPQNFLRGSDTSTFMPKNLNRRSDCIASNPRSFWYYFYLKRLYKRHISVCLKGTVAWEFFTV